MDDRRLLIAGSLGPERIPARLDRDVADWYKPGHVRDAAAARDQISGQVAIGADVVLAPTWLTHRRALMPLGETRQVQAWTNAALSVAREGVELGLERRAEALTGNAAGGQVPERPRPLVGAVLPALDDPLDPDGGRLPTAESATRHDFRDQAGILADARPDVLLVEPQADEAGTRVAMAQAAETGLPTWVALDRRALATTAINDWLEQARALGVSRLLLPPPLDAWQAALRAEQGWGGFGLAADELSDWLDVGAVMVACLDGATDATLARLRAAIDEYEAAGVAVRQAARARWRDHVLRAAAMAPGGAAVWLGTQADVPLAEGFEWLVVDPTEIPQLPSDRFSLVIAQGSAAGVARLVANGGLLVQRGPGGGSGSSQLRLLSVDDGDDPPLSLYRREH